MRLLVTTNGRLYKTPDGKYWTKMVYGYNFFLRYLEIFDEIKLVAHVKLCKSIDVNNMLRVDGESLKIYEVPFPEGKLDYIKKYYSIKKLLNEAIVDCDAAILRIPDQLAFQIYPSLKKNRVPVGVEVTTDSWDFFSPDSIKSIFRPLIRIIWHLQEKYICRTAVGVSFVTKKALQSRYPPKRALKGNGFTTNYTDTNIDQSYLYQPRNYSLGKRTYTIIHVSGSISGHAKGHKELVEAMGLIYKSGVKLKIILVGSGTLSKDVQEIVYKYKIDEIISFKGLISNQNLLRNELINADLFVFPSYREGLPRVIVEAMACGLPCIATDLPGISELLDDDCLVPARNSEAIATKVTELINNPKRLTEISKRNFEKAQEYSVEKMNRKRNLFYKNLKRAAEKREG